MIIFMFPIRDLPTGLMPHCILISHYAMDARFCIDRRRGRLDTMEQGTVPQRIDVGLN
jgi:hypothetical protein